MAVETDRSEVVERRGGSSGGTSRPEGSAEDAACTAYAVGAESERKPEDFGVLAPDAEPDGTTAAAGETAEMEGWSGRGGRRRGRGVRTLPAGPSGRAEAEARTEESDHDDDDAMPPPPGPPPGFEIVIPEAEKGENEAVDAPETNAGDDDDDGEPLPPPPLSPPRTTKTTTKSLSRRHRCLHRASLTMVTKTTPPSNDRGWRRRRRRWCTGHR